MASALPPHLVLARKWRPERLDELVGQEQVTRTLKRALETGRIAHAFLFAGIRGVGKTTAARILARCLNCERGPTPEPCGQCAACREIRDGRALDVVEIDGATYRKIDDARAIIENLSYRPARDRFKVYIIDEAHQLTDQAFNALLKTLEEPPPHVKFILATTEPQKMPETILSRLQRYDFRRIPFAVVTARLKELCAREGAEAEEAALGLIAREAGGSMRDAERTLETALASFGARITESEVAESLGVASRLAVFELAGAILRKDAAAALGAVRRQHAAGASLEALGRDLLETLRNLAVAKLAERGAPSPLEDLPDHEAGELGRLAALASGRDLMRLFKLMADAQEQILRSPYPDMLLEMAVVRMATLAPVLDADELLRALGAGVLPGRGGMNQEPTPSTAASSSAGGSPRSQGRGASTMEHTVGVEGEVGAGIPPGERAEAARAADLPELRERIRTRRAALAGFMEQGAALELSGGLLRVVPLSAIYVRYFSDNRAVIAELASELYGRPIRVEVDQGGGPAAQGGGDRLTENARSGAPSALTDSPSGAPPEPDSAAPADNGGARSSRSDPRKALYADPVVRKIFDEFEARLVEVREGADAPERPGAVGAAAEQAAEGKRISGRAQEE